MKSILTYICTISAIMVASISCVDLSTLPRGTHELCSQNIACPKDTYCRFFDDERRTYGTCEIPE